MKERDKLLGPSRGGPTGQVAASRLWIIIPVSVLAALAIAGLAFFAGQQTAQETKRIPEQAVKKPPSEPIMAPAPIRTFAPTKAVQETFSLKPINDRDWKTIGMGCSCSFTQGIPRVELLIAGGDGVAVFKPNGSRRVCTLREEQTQEMFDGETTISCGQSRVHIKAFGKAQPGFDGHSSQAKMSLIDQGRELNLTGTFGCAC